MTDTGVDLCGGKYSHCEELHSEAAAHEGYYSEASEAAALPGAFPSMHGTEAMTPAVHREAILAEFAEDFRAKYDRGQAEHGGRLWLKDNMARAREEVLDFVAYVYTADRQRKQAIWILEAFERQNLAGTTSGSVLVAEALRLLKGQEEDR